MEPFHQQAVDEELDLRERTSNLAAYLRPNPHVVTEAQVEHTLPPGEFERLNAQLSAMRVYLFVLRERIAVFEADAP